MITARGHGCVPGSAGETPGSASEPGHNPEPHTQASGSQPSVDPQTIEKCGFPAGRVLPPGFSGFS